MNKARWFFLSVLVLIADQLSKHWVLAYLIPYQPKALMPMLNLTLAYNTGAAFSFLGSSGAWHHWFFVAFGSIMSLVLILWLIKLPKQAKLQAAALSLILGGALGNLYDRLALGHVVDFIQLYYKNHYWPVFNLADSAICIGAVLLLIDLVQNREG